MARTQASRVREDGEKRNGEETGAELSGGGEVKGKIKAGKEGMACEKSWIKRGKGKKRK